MYDTAIRICAVTAASTIAMTALVFFTALTWMTLQAFGYIAPPM